MSLFRTVTAIVVVAMAYAALMLIPANVLLKYEAGIYSLVALIAFGAVGWAFVRGRKR